MYAKSNTLLSAAAAFAGLIAPIALAQEREWTSNDGGNLRMEAGDSTINWGSTPPWNIIRQIKDHCSSIGCHGNNELEADTEFVHQASHFDGTVTVSVEASFQSDGELGSLDNLVDLAAELIAEGESYEVEERFWHTGPCRGSRIDPCSSKFRHTSTEQVKAPKLTECFPHTAMETHSIDQYFQTNQIMVRYEDEDGGANAYLHIWVEATRHDDDNSGWCDLITTIGGAVSGAVGQGVAGGAFSLASLGCAAF